jgi:hypothetical protein
MARMTFANETITVGSSATPLTNAVYAARPGASLALLTVEGASVRWWASGSTPTASEGHLAQPGCVIELSDPNELRRFRAIRAASSDAVLQVSYGA